MNAVYEVHSLGDDGEPVIFHASFEAGKSYPNPRAGCQDEPQELWAERAAMAMAKDLNASDGERYVVIRIQRDEMARFG